MVCRASRLSDTACQALGARASFVCSRACADPHQACMLTLVALAASVSTTLIMSYLAQADCCRARCHSSCSCAAALRAADRLRACRHRGRRRRPAGRIEPACSSSNRLKEAVSRSLLQAAQSSEHSCCELGHPAARRALLHVPARPPGPRSRTLLCAIRAHCPCGRALT